MSLDPDALPSLGDIGALLHARTTVAGGGEAGTFNDDTHLSGEKVQTIIELAAEGVAVQLPAEVPEALWPATKLVIALTAAAMVERSYFPEQIAQGASPAEGYEAQAAIALSALLAGAGDNQISGVRMHSIPITTVTAASATPASELLP